MSLRRRTDPVFPREFGDLLNARGRSLVQQPESLREKLARDRFAIVSGALNPRPLERAVRRLDQHLFPSLRLVSSRIDSDSISGMKANYSERLNKTMRIRTAFLDSPNSTSYHTAEQLGLIAMLQSNSLARFAEAVSGLSLRRPAHVQAICYGSRDYAGPHNDHHPEEPGFRDGYLDVQITLTTSGVASQYLVYEKRGHFSEIVDVSRLGSITIYKLPFWHFTTPLVARSGREQSAKRWLLLATFEIDRARKRNGVPRRQST